MKKILIIDNDSFHGDITRKFLRYSRLNHSSDLVASAHEALLYLHSSPLPDIILLDLMMPEMNGIQFLEAFKKIDVVGKDKIQIIVLTISDNAQQKVEALLQGASGVLPKPLNTDQLMKLVGNTW